MFLDYVGIRVLDLDRSLRFYTKALGLRELRRGTMDHGGIWVLLGDSVSRQNLELNYYPGGSAFAHPYTVGEGLDHIGVRVPSPKRTAARLIKAGARPAPTGADAPDGSLIYVVDPDGLWIELIQTSPADARWVLTKRHASASRGRSRRARSS